MLVVVNEESTKPQMITNLICISYSQLGTQNYNINTWVALSIYENWFARCLTSSWAKSSVKLSFLFFFFFFFFSCKSKHSVKLLAQKITLFQLKGIFKGFLILNDNNVKKKMFNKLQQMIWMGHKFYKFFNESLETFNSFVWF